MWKKGTIGIPQKNGGYKAVHYWIKVYEEGSQFGVNGGKISKLMLKRDGEIVCNYDRGWDIEPADPDTQLALEILLHGNNY